MAICNTGAESVPERSFRGIADHIRRKVIYEGLELEEIGIDLADVTDDVRLFDENGLNLDSIDALEILAGVQREFGLSIPNVDQEFMNEHCSTVERLTRMVKDMSGEHRVRGKAGDGAVAGRTSGGRSAIGAGSSARPGDGAFTGRSSGEDVEHVSANAGAASMPSSAAAGDAPPDGAAGARPAHPPADA